jgi:hypothetical protein
VEAFSALILVTAGLRNICRPACLSAGFTDASIAFPTTTCRPAPG